MAVTSDYTQINACDDKSEWTGINFSADDNTSGSPVWAAYEPATARGVSFVASTSTTGSIHEDTNVDMSGKLLVFPLWMVGQEEIGRVTILNVRMHEGTGASGDSGQWDQPIQAMLDAGGGWFPLYAWPTQPDVETGTFVPADVSSFEIELRNNSGDADIKWVIIDDLHWITEVRISGTTPTVHDFTDISDADAAGFWYVFFKTAATEQFQSRVSIELGATATTSTFAATGFALTFLPFNNDQKIGFLFVDGTTNNTNFTLGELSLGTGNPINGGSLVYDALLTGDTDSSDVYTNADDCNVFRVYDTTHVNARDIDLPTGTNSALAEANVEDGGSGYTVGDDLTLAGGTGTAAVVNVDAVSGGVITAVSPINGSRGDYSVLPASPNSPTGGTGSGASINVFFAAFHEVRSSKFSDCGPVILSTCKFEDNQIVNAKDVGALMSSTVHRSKNNTYLGCVHGIEFDTAGEFTLTGDQFQGNTFDVLHSVNAILVDASAGGDTRNTDQQLGNGTIIGVGQALQVGSAGTLSTCQFTLSKTGTPTGNIVAKFYANNGPRGGEDDIPTGAALATSEEFDVSTLTGTPTVVSIQFTDEVSVSALDQRNITLELGTGYSGDASNRVEVGKDTTSPSTIGNLSTLTGSTWSAVANQAAIFGVTRDGIVKVNLVDSNPVTVERTGSPNLGALIFVNNASVTFTNLIVGSEVRVYQQGTSTEIAGIESTVGTTFNFSLSTDLIVDYVILGPIVGNLAYIPIRQEGINWQQNTSIVINQQINRNFFNPP